MLSIEEIRRLDEQLYPVLWDVLKDVYHHDWRTLKLESWPGWSVRLSRISSHDGSPIAGFFVYSIRMVAGSGVWRIETRGGVGAELRSRVEAEILHRLDGPSTEPHPVEVRPSIQPHQVSW